MVRAELKVVGGKQHGKSIPLNTKKFLIGREQDCQLRPSSESVSRHHCVLTIDEYGVQIRDLGSTNGTYVNGERIHSRVLLKPRDRIAIGKLEFEIAVYKQTQIEQPVAVGAQLAEGESSFLETAGQVPASSATMIDIPVGQFLEELNSETAVLAGNTTIIPSAPEPMPAPGPLPVEETFAEQPAVMPPQVAEVPAPMAQATPVAVEQQATPVMVPPPAPALAPPPQTMLPPQGYPPQPYPQQPMYQQPFPPQSYMPPQYPGMPDPQQYYQQQLYQQHLMQQQLYQQQLYQQQQPVMMEEPVEAALSPASSQLSVSLPDPSETGIKQAPPKPPEEKQEASGADAPKPEPKAGDKAANIIKQYMNRR